MTSSNTGGENPNFTPAQNPNYDYKKGIISVTNVSKVTLDGKVSATSSNSKD